MDVEPTAFGKFAFQKVRSNFDKKNCFIHSKFSAASKLSIKYVESEAVWDNFEKLQECQAQRAIDRANVEWGYFTETAPHVCTRYQYH